MDVITPARLINPAAQEYQVRGKVTRVFDTNGSGELLPVEHQIRPDSKFTLSYAPYGKIYAEVER